MLVENRVVDRIEVMENGCVQVRTRVDIVKDDVTIASSFGRKVIVPGDDFSQEDVKVKGICSSVHTSEVVEAYTKEKEENSDIENLVPEEENLVE